MFLTGEATLLLINETMLHGKGKILFLSINIV